MEPNSPHSPSASRLRRWALHAHLAVSGLLACSIFIMLNYLSMRHYARLHWNRDPVAQLSEKSLSLLRSVVDDIRIIAVLRPSNEAYRNVSILLQEYAAASRSVSVEFVDPDRDLARTEQLAGQYRLGDSEGVVFHIGERHQTVAATDLTEPAMFSAMSPVPVATSNTSMSEPSDSDISWYIRS